MGLGRVWSRGEVFDGRTRIRRSWPATVQGNFISISVKGSACAFLLLAFKHFLFCCNSLEVFTVSSWKTHTWILHYTFGPSLNDVISQCISFPYCLGPKNDLLFYLNIIYVKQLICHLYHKQF